jgi:acetolactate synthase small subunit
MRHLIAILLQNEAGALTRVTGLISTRGYNIESLSVAPTDDPTVSRVTLVTIGSDQVTSTETEIGEFIARVAAFGEIVEVVRSGVLGIARANPRLHVVK